MKHWNELADELVEYLDYLITAVVTYINYWDYIYGSPWGRIYMMALLAISTGFWYTVFKAILG